jgi:CheY-like chemotaxis protein
LADDDQDDRQFFKEALDQLSGAIEVVVFDNGVSLIDRLPQSYERLPDIIFLDLNMPLMSGEECLADIRNETKFAKVPVVIYSTFMDRSKVEYLFEKGADRYLQKPTSFDHLKAALQKCMRFLETGGIRNNGLPDFVIEY